MARERVPVLGRDEQRATLDRAAEFGTGNGALLVVRGRAGEGKTALLNAVTSDWRRDGLEIISLSAARHPDTSLVDALLDAVRRYVDRGLDPDLLEAVAEATSRRQLIAEDPQRHLLAMAHELSRAVIRIARRRRTAVIVEDVDRTEPLVAVALCALVQALRAGGCLVVVSARPQTRPSPVPAQLVDLADEIVELAPLPADDARALLSKWGAATGRAALDSLTIDALRTGLGPLYGNPGTLLSTVRALHEQGRLVVVDGHYCLSSSDEPIALPEDHELVRALCDSGDSPHGLAAILATWDPVSVDDLAVVIETVAEDLESTGRMLDELVADGILRVDEQSRLWFAVPALAVTVRQAIDPDLLRTVHAALAQRMLSHVESGAAVDRALLANHLARAGAEPDSPLCADILIDEADRIADCDAARAATWYRGALRRLPHSDPRWPRLVRTLLRLRMALGQYRELAADVGLVTPPVLAATSDDDRAERERMALLVEIGTCWLSALMHEERPAEIRDSIGMFDALGGASGFDADIRRFLSAMFGGRVREAATIINTVFGRWHREAPQPDRRIVDLGEVLVLLNALSGNHQDFQQAWSAWHQPDDPPREVDQEQLREAGALSDYATALELILGEDYGRPGGGSLLGYQQVLRAYHAGDWDNALSVARRIEADHRDGHGGTARHLARVFAAEICCTRGDFQRAAGWLDRIPRAMAGGHLVSWARCGLLYHLGHPEDALRVGWRDYLRHRERGALAGLERLLTRLIRYAWRETDRSLANRLLAELEALDDQLRSSSSREAVLFMQALLDRDREQALQALELTRRRGDLPRAAMGYLLVGDLSADPQPWHQEYYELANRFGCTRGRGPLYDLMRERGVPLPRSRTRQTSFSSTEMRIIDLVSDGFTNRRIAALIGVSEKTVESHLTRLFARTGCRSRLELAAAQLEGRLAATAEDLPHQRQRRGEVLRATAPQGMTQR
ncbi:AAA family ATPase [Saccharopolyspora sp. K220]|uniref:helix-turn-helix transcriptional regulator n=1 Tax=Saccharopolyspora soli TaxID=2926618 RepID=UPI001F55DB05|nr:AAA family ATPase [Saccharopolyspora soli]MCI2417465.1 AAA family ATPase [Saccharopolyspora soli]